VGLGWLGLLPGGGVGRWGDHEVAGVDMNCKRCGVELYGMKEEHDSADECIAMLKAMVGRLEQLYHYLPRERARVWITEHPEQMKDWGWTRSP
jgi:hypothetical protein